MNMLSGATALGGIGGSSSSVSSSFSSDWYASNSLLFSKITQNVREDQEVEVSFFFFMNSYDKEY